MLLSLSLSSLFIPFIIYFILEFAHVPEDVINIKLVYQEPLFTDAQTFFKNKKCLSRVSVIH